MANYIYTPFFDHHQYLGFAVDQGFQDRLLKGMVKPTWAVLDVDSDLGVLQHDDSLYVVAHSNNEVGRMYDKFTDDNNGRGNMLDHTELVWQMMRQGLPNRAIKVHLFGCLTGVRGAHNVTFAQRVARQFGHLGYAQIKTYGYVGFVAHAGNALQAAKKLAADQLTMTRVKSSTKRIVKYDAQGNLLRGTEGRRINNADHSIRIKNV